MKSKFRSFFIVCQASVFDCDRYVAERSMGPSSGGCTARQAPPVVPERTNDPSAAELLERCVHKSAAFGLFPKHPDLRLAAGIIEQRQKVSGLQADRVARIARRSRSKAKSVSWSAECGWAFQCSATVNSPRRPSLRRSTVSSRYFTR